MNQSQSSFWLLIYDLWLIDFIVEDLLILINEFDQSALVLQVGY